MSAEIIWTNYIHLSDMSRRSPDIASEYHSDVFFFCGNKHKKTTTYERGNHTNGWEIISTESGCYHWQRKSYQLTAEVINNWWWERPTPINKFDGFHLGKPILGLHYDPENAFFAPFQYPKYKFWKGMETQKILALEEVRLFHPACQVHTWVDSGKKGLNLQPRLSNGCTLLSLKLLLFFTHSFILF